jgi:hypothetical protein
MLDAVSPFFMLEKYSPRALATIALGPQDFVVRKSVDLDLGYVEAG